MLNHDTIPPAITQEAGGTMAYFSRKQFPIVSAFAQLTRGEQQTVINHCGTHGMGSAAMLAEMFAPLSDETRERRVYELSQAAYALVQDVRRRNALVASVVETFLAGDSNDLRLAPDDMRWVQALAAVRGIQLTR